MIEEVGFLKIIMDNIEDRMVKVKETVFIQKGYLGHTYKLVNFTGLIIII